MSIDKTKLKHEFKDFWDEHGRVIKTGAKCLAIGLFIGFVKGVCTSDKMHADAFSKLIDKIPYEPACDDIAEYVHDHIDELKSYIVTELEYNE